MKLIIIIAKQKMTLQKNVTVGYFKNKTFSKPANIKHRQTVIKSEVNEVELSLHPKCDDEHRVEPLCLA
jgi:hypothetical protein